jgi:hypothetical protein
MNETYLAQFRTKFADAMLDLESEFGIAIKLGNISYNMASFTSKIEVKNLTEEGTPMLDPMHENAAYWRVKNHLGTDPGQVLHQFWILTNGNKVFVTDFCPRNHKYPLKYSYNGQNFKGSIKLLKHKA